MFVVQKYISISAQYLIPCSFTQLQTLEEQIMALSKVPVTVFSGYPVCAIGNSRFQPQSQLQNNCFWILLIDLTSLKSVWEGEWTSNTQFPTPISQYINKPNFLLILTTHGLRIDNLPQGQFYQVLSQIGAGPYLDQAEQICTQMSTGYLGSVCYTLVSTMMTNDLPGFEKVSYSSNFQVLTLDLLPTVINGQTIYIPANPL